MSTLQSLKVFVQQRLTAAVEEVIGHLERTLTEYEEAVQSRLQLGSLQTPGVQQLVIKDEVSYEQQQWSTSLDQADPESPHIKEEEQDLWTSLKGEDQQGLHEEDFTKSPFTRIPVKNGDDEVEAQTTQLHQRQPQGSAEAEPSTSSSTQTMKIEEDYGGSEPGRILGSGCKYLSGSNENMPHFAEGENEDSGDDWKIRKPQTDLNTTKTKASSNDVGCSKLFVCSKCGKRFGQKHHLQAHLRCHTGEKPFSCSLCGKRFSQKGNMTQHLTVHTREKPCSCPVCGERFAQKGNLTQHMTVHTREKPCTCPVCGERFAQKGNLTQHMTVHAREKVCL